MMTSPLSNKRWILVVQSLLIPMIESAEQVVDACRYPPRVGAV